MRFLTKWSAGTQVLYQFSPARQGQIAHCLCSISSSLTKHTSATKWLQLQELEMWVWVYIPNHPFMWGVSSGAMRKYQKRRCYFYSSCCWIFSHLRSLLYFFFLLLLLLFGRLFPVIDLALLGRCGRGCTSSLLWACRLACHSGEVHKKLALPIQPSCLHFSSSVLIPSSDCFFLARILFWKTGGRMKT